MHEQWQISLWLFTFNEFRADKHIMSHYAWKKKYLLDFLIHYSVGTSYSFIVTSTRVLIYSHRILNAKTHVISPFTPRSNLNRSEEIDASGLKNSNMPSTYGIIMSSLVFSAIGAIAKNFNTSIDLASVRTFTSMRSLMYFQIFQPGKWFVASIKLENVKKISYCSGYCMNLLKTMSTHFFYVSIISKTHIS